MRRRRIRIRNVQGRALLVLLFAGCAGDPLVEVGDTRCAVVSVPVAFGEPTPLGFAAEDLAPLLGGGEAELFDDADQPQGTAQVEVALDPAAGGSFLDNALVDAQGEPVDDLTGACGDALAVPVALSFEATDGSWQSFWVVEVVATAATSAAGLVVVDVETLEGVPLAPTEGASLDLAVEAAFDQAGASGRIDALERDEEGELIGSWRWRRWNLQR